ncbi:maleylpyruvate isomerase family mycothiol-dependent enzyme [Yinghuangia sp. YIM S09857]|uniref:maleylpyruvate isomerase family mycothiol-dependent enzyme n=1 Tax=Yinghuangia sp. YIM S09857 TaxID=3436929 RepID=UPI003F52CC7A
MASNTDHEPTGRLAAALDDLTAESAEAFAVLHGLSPDDWLLPTAGGWSVRDHVLHLARFDEVARLAFVDPPASSRIQREDRRRGSGCPDALARELRHMRPLEAHRWFTRARDRLLDAFCSATDETVMPWYGGAADPAAVLSARLVETWTHVQDIVDTVGGQRQPGRRLRRIADLAVRNLVELNGSSGSDVRVELMSPGNGTWLWGPPGVADVVSGSATDFCLVVTGRRTGEQTGLEVTGARAARWAAAVRRSVHAPRCPFPGGSDAARTAKSEGAPA